MYFINGKYFELCLMPQIFEDGSCESLRAADTRFRAELRAIVREVILVTPFYTKPREELMAAVMKAIRGQCNPALVREAIDEELRNP